MRRAAIALAMLACSRDADERRIRGEVDILVEREGQLAEDAANRLAKNDGLRAIPTLETALHTAGTVGRLNIIMALRRIGHADAIPLLTHYAIHDDEEGVRTECLVTLRQWATGTDDRATKARAALRSIEEEQSQEKKG